MTYNELRRMIAFHQSQDKYKRPDWTPEDGCRWFVSLELTEYLRELTNKDLAEYAFDDGWPVCTCKEHVEEWLRDQQINEWTDLDISEWVDSHFGN